MKKKKLENQRKTKNVATGRAALASYPPRPAQTGFIVRSSPSARSAGPLRPSPPPKLRTREAKVCDRAQTLGGQRKDNDNQEPAPPRKHEGQRPDTAHGGGESYDHPRPRGVQPLGENDNVAYWRELEGVGGRKRGGGGAEVVKSVKDS